MIKKKDLPKAKIRIGYFVFLGGLFLSSFYLASIMKLNQPSIVLVSLGDKGFSPREIEVKRGTKVNFVIEGDKEHWPASDFHPTHGRYPQGGGCIGSKLDACKALKKGENYSFVFQKSGSWGMHDHLNPKFTMKVIVEEKVSNKVKNTKIDITAENFENVDDTEKKDFISTLSQKDPDEAQNFLLEVSRKKSVLGNYIHDLTHFIGHGFFNKYGFEGISRCSILLGFGCHHGITEEMLLTVGKDSLKDIELHCQSLPQKDGKDQVFDCIHGLGHGLMSQNSYNLKNTLIDCDKLSSKSHSPCYDGVFMEYSHGSSREDFDEKDPWKLCRGVKSSHQETCANYLPDILKKTIKFDSKTYARICMDAPTKSLADSCVAHIAYTLVRQTNGDRDYVLNSCKKIEGVDYQDLCLITAVGLMKKESYNSQASTDLLCGQIIGNLKSQCR